jgi:uncharacterized membrane protein YbhN (UPF0104 family)
MYLLAGLAVTVVVVAAIGMVADLGAVGDQLRHLRPGPVAGAVAAGLAAHGLRFVRWHLLVGVAGDRRLSAKPSALAFLAGSLFAFTPARAGEVAKAIYARRLGGSTVAGPLAVVAAERIGDVAVMVLLAAAGLLAVGALTSHWPALVGGACLVAALGTGAWIASLSIRGALGRRRGVDPVGPRWLVGFLRPSSQLVSVAGVSVTFGLGMIIWLLEVVVFWLCLAAIGSGGLALALAVFPLASLGGALSMLPAGMGVTEGGIAGLSASVSGVTFDQGLAAALLTRAVISGTVAIPGLGALVAVRGWRRKIDAAKGGAAGEPCGPAGQLSSFSRPGLRSPGCSPSARASACRNRQNA